ncbi:MAG: TRAM domain-containing protein [bacterium]
MGSSPSVQITEVTTGGRGVARVEGKVCFIPGVLPGETVTIEITKDRGGFLEARATALITTSPNRITPACPLAFAIPSSSLHTPHSTLPISSCPGCCYQHATYEEEIRIKNQQLRSTLSRQAGCTEDVLLPPVPSPSALGYRNKLSLHGQIDGKDRRLGYFMEDNLTVLDVPSCPLAVEPINALLKELHGSPSFRRTLRSDVTIIFRWTQKDGALWWRNKAAENDVWLIESSPLGTLSVPRDSFYQMNPGLAELLINTVLKRLSNALPQTVIDLYCGVGVFALAAANLGIPRVIGMDVDGPGLKAAAFNAKKLGLSSIEWITAPAEKGMIKLKLDQPDQTTLIVDPPRTGMGRQMTRDILTQRPARILYISCAPDTMARDVAWLKEGGYQVQSAQLFDMFPRTAHFESLTELTLDPASTPSPFRGEGRGEGVHHKEV